MSILQSSFWTSNMIIATAPGTPGSPSPYFGFGAPVSGVQSTGGRFWMGNGSPDGVLTAPLGSVWVDTASTSGALWINTNGGSEWFSVAMAYHLPFPIPDPGAGGVIPVDFSGTVNLTIAAGVAETNTIGNPTSIGQTMIINADTVGAAGTRAITCAGAINGAGNTIMTFNAVRDAIWLQCISVAGALRWMIVTNISVGLS